MAANGLCTCLGLLLPFLLQQHSCLPCISSASLSGLSSGAGPALTVSGSSCPYRLSFLIYLVLLAYRLSGSNYILTFALSAIPASAALLLVTTAFGKGATAADAANKKKRKGGSSFLWPGKTHLSNPRRQVVGCNQHWLRDRLSSS